MKALPNKKPVRPAAIFARLLCSAGESFRTHPIQNGRMFVVDGSSCLTIFKTGTTLWQGAPPTPIVKRKFDDMATKAGADPPKPTEQPEVCEPARRKTKMPSSGSKKPPWE